MVGSAIALWPASPLRTVAPAPPAPSAAPAPSESLAAATVIGPTDKTLVLPAGVIGVDLAAIPDRFLNDPPAARLRLPVLVRGTRGIASVDAPAEISWTENGYWYWMRSVDLSVPQLIDLAGALR